MPRRIATQHTLEIIKGNRAPNNFDFQALAEPAQLTGPTGIQGGIFYEGRCVHLNPNGRWELGVRDADLPFFLLNNSDDLDVKNDGGDPTTEADAWSPGTPSGKLNAVCALGGFELATTEFFGAATVSYNPNDRLKAPPSDNNPANMLTTAGVMAKSTVNTYAENVVGVVTRARTPTTAKNAHGRDELYFAPCFLPKTGVA